jgi:hypothetical protein
MAKDGKRSEHAIATGPNARPRDEPIVRSAPDLPGDPSKPVEITPEEEKRVAAELRNK